MDIVRDGRQTQDKYNNKYENWHALTIITSALLNVRVLNKRDANCKQQRYLKEYLK